MNSARVFVHPVLPYTRFEISIIDQFHGALLRLWICTELCQTSRS
jgi:hypothetical protein